MNFNDTKSVLEREAARRTFVRQALVTTAMISIEQMMMQSDRDEIAFKEVLDRTRKITGLKLEPDYLQQALTIYSETGWAVEKAQFGDNHTRH